MSLLYAKTRIQQIKELPVFSAEVANINQEGMALTFGGYEEGRRKIRASAGVDDTEFVGISIGPRFDAPTRMTKIEVLTAVSDGGSAAKVVLARPPITGTIYGAKSSTGWGTGTSLAEITGGGSPTNVQLKINGSNAYELLLHADLLGTSIFVVYEYTPSVLEARAKFGEKLPGMLPNVAYGSIGVLTSGEVWTDMYDHAINWAAIDTVGSGEFLKAGANGRFTVSGSGQSLAGLVSVLEIPTVDQPYLGLWLRVD